MATNDLLLTRELQYIPEDFSISILDTDVKDRTLKQGYQFFIEEYVHAIKFDLGRLGEVTIIGRCHKSQKKREAAHTVHLSTTRTLPTRLTDAHCTCQAGSVSDLHIIS